MQRVWVVVVAGGGVTDGAVLSALTVMTIVLSEEKTWLPQVGVVRQKR
jgi:hypothetical protein